MSFVREVIALSSSAGSMVYVSSSTSTKTGVAPRQQDRLPGGDEGVGDGDHLVPGPDP